MFCMRVSWFHKYGLGTYFLLRVAYSLALLLLSVVISCLVVKESQEESEVWVLHMNTVWLTCIGFSIF
jgi:hypothetical protein